MDYKEYLHTDHWKDIRAKVLEFWDHKCSICNSKADLHVHHRSYEHLGDEHENDTVVLCSQCHEKFHKKMPSDPAIPAGFDPFGFSRRRQSARSKQRKEMILKMKEDGMDNLEIARRLMDMRREGNSPVKGMVSATSEEDVVQDERGL